MEFTFSTIIIYKLLLSAFLLFISFRIFSYFTPVIFKKKKYFKLLKRNLPIFEFILWLLFSIWSFKSLLAENQYFAIVVFVVMLSIAIFSVRIFLKDYIAGIMLKADASVMLGDTITSSGYTGIITKFNYRTLELELSNKSNVKIPFTQILNNSLIREKKSQSISAYVFKISSSKNQGIENLIKEIKQSIILLPWSLVNQEPVIKAISETKNTYNLEITVYAYNNDMYFKIEEHIKDKFSV